MKLAIKLAITNILLITRFTLVVASYSANAQAQRLVGADNYQLTQVCMKALQGNRAAFHAHLKERNYSRKYVANNVLCNGEPIVEFVDKYGKRPAGIKKMLGK